MEMCIHSFGMFSDNYHIEEGEYGWIYQYRFDMCSCDDHVEEGGVRMDPLLVISFSCIDSIAFEGVYSSVGYDFGIILTHHVSCHMHGHVFISDFYMC